MRDLRGEVDYRRLSDAAKMGQLMAERAAPAAANELLLLLRVMSLYLGLLGILQ